MALPGLSIPGLNNSGTPSFAPASTASAPSQATRTEELPPRSEWRFEVGFSHQYHIRLESGLAEMFGVELALKQTYTFSGCKGAIFTWQGCQLELSGVAESEYAGQETEYATEWLNVHGELERLRVQSHDGGPRVLVVGPDCVGKTSFVRSLAAWAVRADRSPVVLNLDSREGLLSPPSSLTAVVVDSQMDVETGYGISSMSGPTISPVRTPLVYQYPYASPIEKPEVYKAIITRMALSIMSKLGEDVPVKRSGMIVDSPGTLNDPKNSYDLIAHIVSELSINVILTIGSERLSSDLARRFNANKLSDEAVNVFRISKPGGAVERDSAFMKQLATRQIRQYFFGSVKESLNPHSHTLSLHDLTIFRARSASVIAAESDDAGFNPGDDHDYDVPYANKSNGFTVYEKVSPTTAMTGSLVAIKFCPSSGDEQTIRDSAVMGFLYVAEVDEAKKKVRFLAPHPQRWGDRALVWGHGWPEAVGDLVA